MQDSVSKMKYRLGIDLGTTSLGWAMLRLDEQNEPYAVIRTGVRIFNNGRDPKTEASLAVARRLARQQRRTRDRKIRRKERLIGELVDMGFFPKEPIKRRQLASLDPFELRTEALDRALSPEEFARAIFHLAKRRGFKSNRKTDSGDTESSKMKEAIKRTLNELQNKGFRTVGEWLNMRHQQRLGTRSRIKNVPTGSGKQTTAYDFYLNRFMIEYEFDRIWEKQSQMNPGLFTNERKAILKDIIFYQRPLRPVEPGRCTLMPDNPRAPLALPQQQDFRIYQEVNNLRKIDPTTLLEVNLTLPERDRIVELLQRKPALTFDAVRKALCFNGTFNLEGENRSELKGNLTNCALAKKKLFGESWYSFDAHKRFEIVEHLLQEESEEKLVSWLQRECNLSEESAKNTASVRLPAGYGALCREALDLILPYLKAEVITYDKAVRKAGMNHSELTLAQETGEILPELPYYGQYLKRHVGFGTGKPEDSVEKRYGKIPNPTVHIALNQLRTVVNALIRRYGKPTQIVIELARELKQNKKAKDQYRIEMNHNQIRNKRIRTDISKVLGINPENVKRKDIEKQILWEELNLKDATARCCPYSGKQISAEMLFTDEVEIDHILPFSRTLDDSKNNKVVCIREANRIKGNRTPWEAREDFEKRGWSIEAMTARAQAMPKAKRFRFAEDGYKVWLKDFDGFEARALTDTQYMSRVAREYLQLICPSQTWSVPGQLTGMLRRFLGLNDILGVNGEKNRDDHRHHAVDACVIALTDRSMLQRISTASARAENKHLTRLLESFPAPWATFYEHVTRAVKSICVSHKPEHAYQGAMNEQTAYGLRPDGYVKYRQNGKVEHKKLNVIPQVSVKGTWRHGLNSDGSLKAYKGLKGGSNFCIEIVMGEGGHWEGDVITTYEAYQIVRAKGEAALYGSVSRSGKPLVMRLMQKDIVEMTLEDGRCKMLLYIITQNKQMFFYRIENAGGGREDVSKRPGSLQKALAKKIIVSPIGDFRKEKL